MSRCSLVSRAIHFAHAAGTEGAQDFVRAEPDASCEGQTAAIYRRRRAGSTPNRAKAQYAHGPRPGPWRAIRAGRPARDKPAHPAEQRAIRRGDGDGDGYRLSARKMKILDDFLFKGHQRLQSPEDSRAICSPIPGRASLSIAPNQTLHLAGPVHTPAGQWSLGARFVIAGSASPCSSTVASAARSTYTNLVPTHLTGEGDT